MSDHDPKSRDIDKNVPAPRGFELLNDPELNKGTAFTEGERDALAIHGLCRPGFPIWISRRSA